MRFSLRSLSSSPLLLLYSSALLFLTACGDEAPDTASTASPDTTAATIPFRQDGDLTFLRDGEPLVDVAIEIAETDSARQRGLMQRGPLPEKSAMLFVFDEEEMQSFWMANTPVALDILFVSADSQIVDIAKYVQPLSPKNVTSSDPALYVVEVPAGFTDSYGLSETDRVRWTRD